MKLTFFILGLLLGITLTAIAIQIALDSSGNTITPNNNGIIFIWNDDEESIPKDGSLIRLQYTDENTVFIGPQ